MIDAIQKQLDGFPAAERRVALAVLARPEQTVHENIAALAERSEVSEPTVVRFCRSLGLDGFRQFKVEIARSLERDSAVIHVDVDGSEEMPQLVDKLVARATHDLGRVRHSLDGAQVAAAVKVLKEARTVEFWGLGASGLVAADAQNKFFRLKIPCVSYFDVPTLLQSASLRGPDDVVVAISNSGDSELLNKACTTAQSNGASIVAVTASGTRLAEQSDFVLAVDVDEDDNRYTPRSSRLAHLLTIDILQVALAVQIGPAAAERLRATKAALSDYQSIFKPG